MASYVFNVAKGRVNELHKNVQSGAVTAAQIVIVAINSSDTVEAIKDADTLAAVLGLASTAEVSGGSGYARKDLDDADLNALSINDTTNVQVAGFANDQTWSAVTGTSNWTHLVFCYDVAGNGADSALVPLTFHDFAKTPDGSDIILSAGDYYSAGE